MKKKLLLLGLALGLILIIAACTPAAAPTAAPVDQPACPTAEPCPAAAEPMVDTPFAAMWEASGHADKEAPAFTHWDEDDPKVVEADCAKCHSSTGFIDFVGGDGTPAGTIDNVVPTGTVITCTTCHNSGTEMMTEVTFPSGKVISGLGREAVCMTCHQGAASKVQVDEAIAKANAADDDTVSADLGFTNVHYFAAAVARYGKEVQGGYEYEGKAYDSMFDHVVGVQTCTDCHDSHSLELKVEKCGQCHEGVATVEDTHNIRWEASTVDYNGNGDVKEGIGKEIEGLQSMLYTAIQAYANEVAKSPIVYSKDAYPYFFIDTNANGSVDDGEAIFPNSYKSWSPRLLKAAYNYQTSIKDPGAFAHGGKYIIELVYDSIEDLNTKIANPVDLSMAHRIDAGHFAGSEEAFRHWDAEGEVPAACVKCHTGEGLPQFIKNGANVAMEPTSGLLCDSCHDPANEFKPFALNSVVFPSGASLSFGEGDVSNTCLQCHQGRESSVSIEKAVASLEPNMTSDKIRFRNVHYFAAGATLFGTEAKGVYEYPGMTYLGKFEHVEGFATCTDCHDAHGLEVKAETCKGCHGTDDVAAIRAAGDATDYDGDGDTTEGITGEIETMKEKLYAALQGYAKDTLKAGIIYDPVAYPYYFPDVDNNGEVDKDADGKILSVNFWSPRLLEGAYNYQYAMKDPGAAAHNGKYVIQVLYDSIKDLGGSVAGMTRP